MDVFITHILYSFVLLNGILNILRTLTNNSLIIEKTVFIDFNYALCYYVVIIRRIMVYPPLFWRVSMETKRNLKYFTAPPISVLAIIGLAVAVVGIIFLIIGVRDLTVPGIIVIIVGVALAILGSGGKSNDTDIEFNVTERIKDLQELSEKKFEVYEKNFLKMLKPINLRGYDFEAKETPFYYKKGSDGVNRTNYFQGCNVIFTSEKIYVYARRFSLIDESIDETLTSSFFYNELSDATIEEKEFQHETKGKTTTLKYYVFAINKTDGTPALRMCVDYGADIDNFVDMISRAINTRKKELEKRAQETIERRAAFRAKLEADKLAEQQSAETQS